MVDCRRRILRVLLLLGLGFDLGFAANTSREVPKPMVVVTTIHVCARMGIAMIILWLRLLQLFNGSLPMHDEVSMETAKIKGKVPLHVGSSVGDSNGTHHYGKEEPYIGKLVEIYALDGVNR
ncbi:hypothetical protein Tco_0698977 [Tanacetum coccineum]